MKTRRVIGLAAVAVLFVASLPIGLVLVRHPSSMALSKAQPSRSPGTPSSTSAARPSSAPPPTPGQKPSVAPPAPTPRPTAPITPVGYFSTLPPNAALPTDAQCALKVGGNPWEPRPQNAAANHTNAYVQGLRLQNSYLAGFGDGYEGRVTGNFTGTTDQLLRWGACKWGFDENTVRAQAVVESDWKQSTLGDCNGQPTQPQTQGCESVGILQVRGADIPPTHPGTWPAAWTSTAFNIDYTLAVRRLCFEGKETWLRQFNASYGAGDLWGCIGRWYSGRWHDQGADQYIQKVQSVDAAHPWTAW